MRVRNVVLAALFAGALLFAGAVSAQPQPAGGRQGRPGGGADAGAQGARQDERGGQRPDAPDFRQMREEMQKRRDEQMKTALQMNDMEWLALDQKIQKVQAIQREIEQLSATGGGRMGRGGFPMMGGPVGPDGQPPQGPGAQARVPVTEAGKIAQELQTLLNDKEATAEEITAKLQQLRDARAKLPEELAAARAEVLEGLAPRQEAQLVLMGILQ